MNISDVDKQRLRQIVSKWSDVQAEIKRAEQISRLAVGPSVNELRYAGRILVSAFVKELDPTPIPLNDKEELNLNEISFSEKIVIADQYLTNAENDISDSLFYFFQSRADEINDRYGAKAVTDRNPNYQTFLDGLKISRDLIIESRRNIEMRKKNYTKLKPIREQLIVNYFDLQKSDALMSLEIFEKDAQIRRYRVACASLISLIFIFAVVQYFLK